MKLKEIEKNNKMDVRWASDNNQNLNATQRSGVAF